MLLLPGFLVLLAVFTVNGIIRPAGDDEFPYQVSVQTPERQHLCGGIIITPKWVLTGSNCVKDQKTVKVVYGSADSSKLYRTVLSEKIEHEPVFNPELKNRLAVIQLQSPAELSLTSRQASMPMCSVQLRNGTSLSGWRSPEGNNSSQNVLPSLYVDDEYLIMTEYCKLETGEYVKLLPGQFCGTQEDEEKLNNPGTVVSRKSIILGMLTDSPEEDQPQMFSKMSSHEQWITGILGPDALDMEWVTKVPGDDDSGPPHCAVSLALLGISTFLLRLI